MVVIMVVNTVINMVVTTVVNNGGCCSCSDKQCILDPMPTNLLKGNSQVLAPFLVELFNRSRMLGVVPSIYKSVNITPLLMKSDLDPAGVKSYRPISNLLVRSSCWSVSSHDNYSTTCCR